MSLTTGILSDIAAVGGGERSAMTPVVLGVSSFEDGLIVGRFCKLDTGRADNFDGSATPTPLGVVLRKVTNAIEDAGTYDADITEQVDILRSGIVTVEVKPGETPALAGRVYISNDGDANDGLVTATASDVAVNAEFIREVKTGVWEISLNLPQGDVSTHIADTTGAHAASAISVADAGDLLTAANVEAALAEIQGNLNDHEGAAAGAHAASAISIADAGEYTEETDAEAAIQELYARASAITPVAIADPGNAGAIPVTASGWMQLVSAGAEIRTLANPSAGGIQLDLLTDTYVGDITITVAGPIDQSLNNTITMGAEDDFISLRSVAKGAGFVWRVVANDGATLSQV